MSIKPKKVFLRTYQVGFGDCFLMSIQYSDNSERHILVDFGSTGLPSFLKPADKKDWMKRVAEDVKTRCNSQLDVVIATHRHKDHISGFTTNDDGKGTGDIIASCKPKLVIQPWTEDPKAQDPKKPLNALFNADDVKGFSAQSFTASLKNMQMVAGSIVNEVQNLSNVQRFSRTISASMKEEIEFIGDDNLANLSAVKNLATMGKNVYINYGFDLNSLLKDILPNIKVKVLGPPTIDQHKEVLNEDDENENEFWMLQAMSKNFWGMQSATSELTGKLIKGEVRLFPDARFENRSVPSHKRWFIRKLRQIRAEQLLSLVRILDDAMNNTSLIFLFQIGDKKLLFPGDAQIENWEYALKFAKDKDQNLELLKDTDLYKVGHHGSRNATPKTLWNTFGNKKSETDEKNVMTSVVSTMHGKHGKEKNHSEVPRETLVAELVKESNYLTTQELTDNQNLHLPDIVIDL